MDLLPTSCVGEVSFSLLMYGYCTFPAHYLLAPLTIPAGHLTATIAKR
jgi:hypothetical protein